MAGRQLRALGTSLRNAGWPADTPVVVVSRAGWPDQLASDHPLAELAEAAMLHAGRPTVVTVGIGAKPIGKSRQPVPASTSGPARQALPLQP